MRWPVASWMKSAISRSRLAAHRQAGGQAAHRAQKADRRDRPCQVMDGGHARHQPAEVHVGLGADRLGHVAAGAADGVLAQREADHVGQDVRAADGRRLFDLALEKAGVFRQDADADLGRQEPESEGAALAAHVEVALAEDEPGPDEAAVGGDLFGSEQQLADALRRPLGDAFAAGQPPDVNCHSGMQMARTSATASTSQGHSRLGRCEGLYAMLRSWRPHAGRGRARVQRIVGDESGGCQVMREKRFCRA